VVISSSGSLFDHFLAANGDSGSNEIMQFGIGAGKLTAEDCPELGDQSRTGFLFKRLGFLRFELPPLFAEGRELG
jgi:hypothetical protein